jgi:hypothetical protein
MSTRVSAPKDTFFKTIRSLEDLVEGRGIAGKEAEEDEAELDPGHCYQEYRTHTTLE